MKNATLLLSLLASAMLTSWAGVSPTRIIVIPSAPPAVRPSATNSAKDPLITTASAGAGVLLSESLQAGSNASARKAYDAGYDKARSDSAKQRFQTLNDRQGFGPQVDDRIHVRSVEVPLPERQESASSSRPAAQPSAFRSKASTPMKSMVSFATLLASPHRISITRRLARGAAMSASFCRQVHASMRFQIRIV